MRLAELLNTKTKELMQEQLSIPTVIDFNSIDFDKVINSDYIRYPTIFNRELGVWMCRSSNFSFCKRYESNINERPDCANCAIRNK